MKMQIILKKITEIFPYENNPRNNDDAVQPVADSIREFGFKVPIIIDKAGTIVAGHTRYRAAQMLGIKEVPVIVADDLNENQIKAFRLIDNKASEFAEWDFVALDEELKGIDIEAFDFDFSEFGFPEEFTTSFIDDLEEGDVYSSVMGDKETFNITLTLKKEHEEKVNKFISDNGKESLVVAILERIANYGN